MKWYVIVALLFAAAVVSVAGVWIYTSYNTFPGKAMPGGTFTVNGQERQIPNLPHKRYGTKQEARMDRPVPMLSEDTLVALDELIAKTFPLMDDTGVNWWCTGGSLISAVLWDTPMCYDDDVDISIRFRDKDKLWTPEFFAKAEEAGLEAFVMRGVTRSWAPTKEMSALRLRKKGTRYPTVDVFFLDWDEDQQKWAHVNGWKGDKVYYDKKTEVWDKEWLYPLQKKEINGVQWSLPAQPDNMLDKHYGPEWKTTIKSPSPLFKSHQFAFLISNAFGAWKTLSAKNHAIPPTPQESSPEQPTPETAPQQQPLVAT